MGFSFPNLEHFFGAYLHQDFEGTLRQAIKEYIAEGGNTNVLKVEINRLNSGPLTHNEIVTISKKLSMGDPMVYKISDETNLQEWYANFVKLIDEIEAEQMQ